ncbi:ADP-forming succinate--CoA ligase subunit beta [Candidatus Borrarchaeum sp.]|uniref:ADP-forming succinate--CoA ligase subunit beta n=1 Tax=Candidatus Borrarchaeum sp. TaxID=2846742 RepID=UPI00257B5A96|nr:ADP-forming succinate--CoA ligase subunit beta [Candidatus Borrarchaeum sp.]
MKLHEYEAKKIFAEYGVPVPNGEIASNSDEVKAIADRLNRPVVVKSQILVSGRGKAGGIKIAEKSEDAKTVSQSILGMNIKGLTVEKVLVEERLNIAKEFYLSIIVDRSARSYVTITAKEGGVDIEQLALEKPDQILKVYIQPYFGIRTFEVRKLAQFLTSSRELQKEIISIINKFFEVVTAYDCELIESNPLVLTKEGKIIAADARMIIDDNSLFRHPQLQDKAKEELRDLTEFELRAKEFGFSYVDLDGNIGIIANGAGLTMASMDIIDFYGGRPANFLDIGGGARAERMLEATKLLLENPRVKGILVNILGGITRGDEVAQGIVDALKITAVNKPIVIRLVGTREKEGQKILEEAGIEYLKSMETAAKRIVELVGSGG